MKHVLSPANLDVLAQYAWARVLLAFDFDGTLAPIVPRRDDARMRVRTRDLLAGLCARYPCAVISGRSEADVEARLNGVGVPHIIGNHGMEPGDSLARFEAEVAAIRPLLMRALAHEPGIDIEDKRFSLALHYRKSRRRMQAQACIRAAVTGLPHPVRAIPGKWVVNLVPANAPNKGDALRALRAQLGLDAAVFVGDDETDEDVFALDEPGRLLTIRVGLSHKSAAAYFVKDQREVDPLLAALVRFRPPEQAT
ncbi:MAG: trehalose-phosphatase [Deltaproteobacteria bacterium]|nr:trehalose-phosphatase [Deltaproteobacteria bacterium]